MLTTIYKIDSIYDGDGNKKENQYRIDRWFIKAVSIGASAILVDVDDESYQGRSLITSKVKDIQILDNTIKLTTENSVYWLKPFAQGV